jgi:hypothetical protein
MSARSKASLGMVVDLRSVADENFLTKVVDMLAQLRSESELRGHLLLASLLEITKGEAEDGLKTCVENLRFSPERERIREEGWEEEEGLLRMAEKLSCRSNARVS